MHVQPWCDDMTCPICHGPTEWRGSLSRGRMACPKCDPDYDAKAMVFGKGHVSLVLARYYGEVIAWHRDWCNAIRDKRARGVGASSDPLLCTCGHTQKTPHTEAQIEQFEIANYGRPTP